MKKRRNKLRVAGYFVLATLLLLIGFLLGKLLTVPGFVLSREINPLHFISILCSVFIAIYVAIILDRHKESKKIQRELIFKRVDDLQNHIIYMSDVIDKDTISWTNVTASIKRISLFFNLVDKILTLVNIDNSDFKSKFERHHKELRNLMTNTPIKIASGGRVPIACKKGVIKYDKNRIQEIEIQIESLRSCIFELQINIASQ